MNTVIKKADEKMAKSVSHLEVEFSEVRAGRANPSVLDKVRVDYYGSPTPLNQISSITVPEPRQLLIKPYDRNDVKNIVNAIHTSDLGLNPINEGTQVRLMIPVLTEERRRDIVKQDRKYGEEAKIAIRNIRRDYMDLIKGDEEMSEDYQKKVQEDLEKAVSDVIKNVDAVVADKEKELMTL